MTVISQWDHNEYELTVECDSTRVLDVLQAAFAIQQDYTAVEGTPSMSAGDIIHFEDEWWICTNNGWLSLRDCEVISWFRAERASEEMFNLMRKWNKRYISHLSLIHI